MTNQNHETNPLQQAVQSLADMQQKIKEQEELLRRGLDAVQHGENMTALYDVLAERATSTDKNAR